MKQIISIALAAAILSSCSSRKETATDIAYIDSLLSNYTPSQSEKINAADLIFWKKALDTLPGTFSNEVKYAGSLAGRFHLYGDISDIRSADSIISKLNIEYKETDAGPLRTLAGYAILQHRFLEADQFIQKALVIGSDKYASELIAFDVALERGNYEKARAILRACRSTNDYGYFFRLSKYMHYDGTLDSSIEAMKKAAELAGGNDALKQAALSNTADLYLHAADPVKAADLYRQSLQLGASDYHSLMGLGWIALVYDKKDSLAERIFRFVQTKTKSPEPLLKLMQVAQQRGDSMMEKKYALDFIQQVSDTAYGNMYNKYLVELYNDVLDEPYKAVKTAEREIANRATPQTYAWYVYSLFRNGEQAKAMELYEKYVSGKPLEGLELYYMGMMMKRMNKGYNADNYFKSARKNRYDLSPAKQLFLEGLYN